jgi:predicted AAA+ superfamily ATPase
MQLTDESKDREIEGLVKAMESFSLSSGMIVTENQRDTIQVGKHRIEIVPFWDWSLR